MDIACKEREGRRARGGCAAVCAVVTVLTVLASQVAAQNVQWQAPVDECQRGDWLLDQLRAVLGAQASSIDVRVALARTGTEWQVDILLPSLGYARQITASDCDAAAEGAVVVVAVAIDPSIELPESFAPLPPVTIPSVVVDEPPRLVAQAPPRQPPVERAEALASRPAANEQRSRVQDAPRAEFEIAPSVAAGIGIVPDVGVGVGVSAGVRRGAWALRVGGAYWFRRQAELGDGTERGAELFLWAGSAQGCLELSRPWLSGCVGAEAGLLRGRGINIREPVAASGLWLAASAGPRLSIGLGGGTRLWALAEAVVPLNRPEYVIAGVGSVYRVDAIAARLTLGASWGG